MSALLSALRDPEVRDVATMLLGQMGATEAVPDVTRLLRAGGPGTRSSALKALTRLDARQALPDVLHLVTSDTNAAVRANAVSAARRLGEADAVLPTLIAALDDPDGVVSACAAENLGWIADESVIPAIQAASDRMSFFYRRACRRAVRRIRKRHSQ